MAIYLDHAATSPMSREIIDAYAAALAVVGNPSSIHTQGQNAKRMLEEARERIAASVGAEAVEVVLTSGGTEAVNLGVKGLYWARNAGGRSRPRIISAAGEHHAAIDAIDWLVRSEGATVEWIPIDVVGRVDLAALRAALDGAPDEVALISVMWANNEVGTIQPIAEVVALAAEHGIPVHSDAVAAYGYLPLPFDESGLAAMSISAHKIGGPVGAGALVLARSATVEPLLHGGNQQRARSGTQDAAGAVAFGTAATRATVAIAAHAARLSELRDRLVVGIRSAVPTAVLQGDPQSAGRLPGNAHFTFSGCEGDSLLFLLDVAGFSVSTGSACQAGVPEASHVLLAMGLSDNDARGALRFTLGSETTEAEVDALIAALPDAVARASRAGLAAPSA